MWLAQVDSAPEPSVLTVFLKLMVEDVWGTPLVILLLGGGTILIGFTKGIFLRGLPRSLLLLAGKFHHKGG